LGPGFRRDDRYEEESLSGRITCEQGELAGWRFYLFFSLIRFDGGGGGGGGVSSSEASAFTCAKRCNESVDHEGVDNAAKLKPIVVDITKKRRMIFSSILIE
jgi:hypothetical protein